MPEKAEERQEEKKTVVTPVDHAAVQAEAAAVASNMVDTKLQLKELYDKYTQGMSKKEKVSFALWFERNFITAQEQARATNQNINYDALFAHTKKQYDEFGKEEESTKEDNPEKGSPKGKVATPKAGVVDVPDIIDEPDYILADNDKYVEAREAVYNGLRTYKQPEVNKEFFANLVKVK